MPRQTAQRTAILTTTDFLTARGAGSVDSGRTANHRDNGSGEDGITGADEVALGTAPRDNDSDSDDDGIPVTVDIE